MYMFLRYGLQLVAPALCIDAVPWLYINISPMLRLTGLQQHFEEQLEILFLCGRPTSLHIIYILQKKNIRI